MEIVKLIHLSFFLNFNLEIVKQNEKEILQVKMSTIPFYFKH